MAGTDRLDVEDIIRRLLQGKRRHSVKLWKTFTDCFNCLPVAATIEGKIFCCHGGLSPELENIDSINKLPRPTDVPSKGLLCDLLWSDPGKDTKLWGSNDRGVSFTFGDDVVTSFLQQHDFDLICRAHQVVQDGYEFFARRQLVTIFSAPNYCGEFDNAGAMLSVKEDLLCQFHVIKPIKKQISLKYRARPLEDYTVSQDVYSYYRNSESGEYDGRLQEQEQMSTDADQMLQEHQHLQEVKKREEEQNRKHKKQKNNQQQEKHPEKQDLRQHKQTQGQENLQKEEKKDLNKDQQKHERHNQKQESMDKGKHLKEQKQKHENFTDQQLRPDKMTQTCIKQPTEGIKSSRMQNHKEKEEDDDNKSSCILS